MNDEIAKLALSYNLAEHLHEMWRTLIIKKDGSYEPREKKTQDEEWININGKDTVDIANLSFEKLPSDYQENYLEEARVAIELVYEKINCGRDIALDDLENMAKTIHNEWLKRNNWVHDPIYGNKKLSLPYEKIAKPEQDKYKAEILTAGRMVKSYFNNIINIGEICEKYHIEIKNFTKKKV